MRFRIPPQLKETVTVVRKSAFERDSETTIVSNVVCLIVPATDIIRVEEGVPTSNIEWVALLEKPNSDISEGDVIRREDDMELQIHRVRALGTVMQLELKDDDQVVL